MSEQKWQTVVKKGSKPAPTRQSKYLDVTRSETSPTFLLMHGSNEYAEGKTQAKNSHPISSTPPALSSERDTKPVVKNQQSFEKYLKQVSRENVV